MTPTRLPALDVLDGVKRRTRTAFAHPRYGNPLKLVVAYLLLVEIGVQAVFGHIDIPFLEVGFLEVGRKADSIPRGVILGGMVLGSLYALVGMGLILVYRANRVINFAQASLGAVPATLAVLLIARQGVPYLVAVPVALVGAAALGAGVEVVVVRRFADAPRLILTVATLGIGLLLAVLDFVVKATVTGSVIDVTKLSLHTPFDRFKLRLGPTTLNGNHFAAVIVVTALVGATSALLKYSSIGVAVRASAENRNRAALLGIPVRRVSTIIWSLAAILSAVGVFLRTPLVGVTFGGTVSLYILLFGLVAAVMARMESLPTCLFAGMLLGIIDRSAVFSTNTSSIAIATMLPVVLVALLLQRRNGARSLDLDFSGFSLAREYRKVPVELRGVREVRVARAALYAVVGLVALSFPYAVGPIEAGLATKMISYAIVAVSLVMLTGWGGQVSLGQFGLAGIGAAVAGGLAANHRQDFFVTVLAGMAAGALVAVLIGLPALRIQGLFLAVTTLAFALTVENFVINRDYFAWLLPKSGNFVEPPILWGRLELGTTREVSVFGIYHFNLAYEQRMYYLGLVLLVGVLVGARSFRTLRSGRVLIGARDNGRLIQAFGVNLATTRLAAFALSGAVAALGGILLAYQQTSVDRQTFSANESVQVLVMAVIGGVGTLPGAVMGVVAVLGLPLLPGLRDIDQIKLLVSGIGVLFVLVTVPGGMSQVAYSLRDRFLRWVAARHGIHVPSLVADSLTTTDDDAIVTLEHDLPSHPSPTHRELAELAEPGGRR